MDNVDNVITVIFGVLAAAVVIGVITVIVRRHGEKKQNHLEAQQEVPAEDVSHVMAVNGYLIDHDITHTLLTECYEMYCREHAIRVKKNTPSDEGFRNDLLALDEEILGQKARDDEMLPNLSPDEEWVVTSRHEEWNKFRQGIKEMRAWIPTN